MKIQDMLEILFLLLERRRMTAGQLASRLGCSVRSVHRYVDELTVAGIPIDVARGPAGGFIIADNYKLPRGFFTREEYTEVLSAIRAMLENTDDDVLRSAETKLSAVYKTERFDTSISGDILADYGTWGDERKFSEKLRLLHRAIQNSTALEVEYVDRGGERTKRVVLPHLLVYKQNMWYLWAYCRLREDFRIFKIGRMRSILETGETFERIPFERDDIPLTFWRDGEKTVRAKFAVAPEALAFAEEWLGIENVRETESGYIAEAELPDDESLAGKILSAGAGLCVTEPKELAERIKKEAEKISASYCG